MNTDLSLGEQKNIIITIVGDIFEDTDAIEDWLLHVGFDLLGIRHVSDFEAAYLAHYRIRPGLYDIERATRDLATWPPVVRLIEQERERQKAGSSAV